MRLSAHWRPALGALCLGTGVAFAPMVAQADPTSGAPFAVAAEELGVIEFTVPASLVGPVTSLLADLTSLPSGNTAVFTTEPDNMSGTFHWSPDVGTEGTYVISFVTTAGGTSHTDQTTLVIFANGISARTGGSFLWIGPLGGPDFYQVTFVATDQGGAATLEIPVYIYNSGCCVSGICEDVREERPVQNRAAGALSATFSLPGMSWSGNNVGYYWCFPYCCYEQYPADLSVEAFSTNPGSDLDLSCPFSPESFWITYLMRDPRLSAPATVQGDVTIPLAVEVGASDPDGDPIASLTVDLSGLPAGNNATFTEGEDHLHGTMTWSPEMADSGDYTVVFRAANLMTATTMTSIHVRGPSEITAVETAGRSVFSARLRQNPLGADSRLQLVTTRPGSVAVSLFDARGRLVREVQPSVSLGPGKHDIPIQDVDRSGRRLVSGIYFYRVESSEGVLVGRLAVLK